MGENLLDLSLCGNKMHKILSPFYFRPEGYHPHRFAFSEAKEAKLIKPRRQRLHLR